MSISTKHCSDEKYLFRFLFRVVVFQLILLLNRTVSLSKFTSDFPKLFIFTTLTNKLAFSSNFYPAQKWVFGNTSVFQKKSIWKFFLELLWESKHLSKQIIVTELEQDYLSSYFHPEWILDVNYLIPMKIPSMLQGLLWEVRIISERFLVRAKSSIVNIFFLQDKWVLNVKITFWFKGAANVWGLTQV